MSTLTAEDLRARKVALKIDLRTRPSLRLLFVHGHNMKRDSIATVDERYYRADQFDLAVEDLRDWWKAANGTGK